MPETVTPILARDYPPLPPTPGPRIPDPLPYAADDNAGQLEQIDHVLERFHYAEHGGSFRFCSGRPCREVAEIRRGPGLL